MLGVKRGDNVKVVAGRSRGMAGKVLSVDRVKNRVVVEHVQMVKKHMRANPSKNVKGGIAERESPVHVSNVMLLCPTCGPIRPKTKWEKRPGLKRRAWRVCGKCGNSFE